MKDTTSEYEPIPNDPCPICNGDLDPLDAQHVYCTRCEVELEYSVYVDEDHERRWGYNILNRGWY